MKNSINFIDSIVKPSKIKQEQVNLKEYVLKRNLEIGEMFYNEKIKIDSKRQNVYKNDFLTFKSENEAIDNQDKLLFRQEVSFYNLNGPSYSNTAQVEFGWEIRKRLNVKTAYRYVDTKVNYQTGLLQKALVSMHRTFINIGYETKNKHWLFDATLQYNGKKRSPSTRNNPEAYQRAEYSPNFYNVLAQITYLTKIIHRYPQALNK